MPLLGSVISRASNKLGLTQFLNQIRSQGSGIRYRRNLGTVPGKGNNGDDKTENDSGVVLPEEPQNCCMSGCANCVWISYAEEVAKRLNDGGEVAKAKILKNVKDPNLRSFLLLELDHVFKKKK